MELTLRFRLSWAPLVQLKRTYWPRPAQLLERSTGYGISRISKKTKSPFGTDASQHLAFPHGLILSLSQCIGRFRSAGR